MNESSPVRNKITSNSDNPRWSQLHPSDLDFVQQDQVTLTVKADDHYRGQVSQHPGPYPRLLLSAWGSGDHGGVISARH